MPTKVVSEILGHKTISVTSDIYQHVIPVMQEEAVSLVAGAIFEHVSEGDVNIP